MQGYIFKNSYAGVLNVLWEKMKVKYRRFNLTFNHKFIFFSILRIKPKKKLRSDQTYLSQNLRGGYHENNYLCSRIRDPYVYKCIYLG